MNERRGGYHSELRGYTSAQRKTNGKRVRQREANREPENFGKINWRAYQHRQLWDMVKSANTGQMATRTYEWQRLSADVDQATADVRKVVQTLVLSWKGPSAVAGAASASRLTEWAADASQRAYQVGTGLDTYTAAVDEAARAMPEPVHVDAEKWFRDGYDVTALDGPQGAYMLDQLLDDHKPTKQEQQEAMDRAVRVMEQYESASYDVGARLPMFDEAPTGTQVTPEQPPPPPTPVPPPVGNPFPAPVLPSNPVLPAGPPSPFPLGERPDGTTGVASVTGAPGVGVPGAHGSQPGLGGAPYGPGTAHGTGGAHGPGGVYGPGGAYGTRSGLGTGGGPGFGGASGVIGAAPGGGAAAGRGGFGPGAGGPQGAGMYPPMAPANREEDREHRNRYDLGLDLLDDLPPAFPPVLGE